MRKGNVFFNGILAGVLIEETRNNYVFRYEEQYFVNSGLPDISLTLPKSQKEFYSAYLFPFFSNMLAEGVNRQLQTRQFQIDEEDSFGLLLATAGYDTIGAVTIKPAD